MTATVRALLGKELQQHKATFLWLAGFSAVVTWLLFRVIVAGGQVLSYLSITSIFAVPALVICAFVIGQRLIAAEYYGHTQRFIEALPIQQAYVHWVRYAVGLLSLLVLMGGVWLACLLAANRTESITTVFVALMAARLGAFVFALWSMVFTFSLLGRLRIPLIAAAALAVSLINNFTGFEMDRFGPLALMDRQLFAFERTALPTRELIETLTGGALMLAIGMWLAHLREGSLVEALATPVTPRAKGFLIALAVTTLGIYTYFGPEPEAAPFAFSDAYVAVDGPVEIAYLDPRFEADAQGVLTYLAERTRALRELAPAPGDDFRIRVALAPVDEPSEFHTLLTSATEGVAASANFEASDAWDRELFGAYMIHQILYSQSEGRFSFEPHHWLLDGFARWWAARGELNVSPSPDGQIDDVMLEALHTLRDMTINEQLLQQWDLSSDRLGEYSVMSVAYSGWRVLQEQRGTDAALRLAAQEFNRPSYGDVRDWWRDWRDPLPARFERATGWSWREFITTWDQRLTELRSAPPYRDAIAGIPQQNLTITPQVDERGVRALRFLLTLDRPLPTGSRCLALHARLPSYDHPVGRTMLREIEVPWPDPGELGPALSVDYLQVGEYGMGARVFAAFECQFPQFSAPRYLGSVRLTMP